MYNPEIEELEILLGIKFQNKELLELATIHKSWCVENKIAYNNERLEFLGDSVLAIIISEYLYKTYPDKDEGSLSKLKSVLVSKTQLAKWGKQLNLGKYVLISKAEEQSGGRKKDTIIASMFEAILGAIYLDQNLNKCREFMINNFLSKPLNIELEDYKSTLQEKVQKELKVLPEYTIIKETGPDHDKEFECIVKVNDKILGHGKGKTKKQAQQNAAKEAIKNLGF